MKIKVFYNYILWLLGIREILPSDITLAKEIKESNQEFVEIGDNFLKLNYVTKEFYGRQGVVKKLEKLTPD